jgi:hypothetical protein
VSLFGVLPLSVAVVLVSDFAASVLVSDFAASVLLADSLVDVESDFPFCA